MTDSHLERIREQFTRQAETYARMKQTSDEKALDLIAALTGVGEADRALDVACGPGFLTMAFAKQCREAVGVDATEALLALATQEAQRRGLSNLRFQAGDAEALPFDDASFDIVSCRAAFHHFERPDSVLGEMKRVVRPGGIVLVADFLTAANPAKAAYHDRIERLCDPTHVAALTEPQFDRLFEEAGLDVEMKPTATIDYDVDEWMRHGGPSPAAQREIRTLLEASIDDDRSGLRVRREAGGLRFSHHAAAFVSRVRLA